MPDAGSNIGRGSTDPVVFIVHAAIDAVRARRLADMFGSRGLHAVPIARILATSVSFRNIITVWTLLTSLTLLLVSPESNDDDVFVNAVNVLRDVDAVRRRSCFVAAVRLGDVDIPGPVNRGYVSASLSHFASDEGVQVIVNQVVLLAAWRAMPPTPSVETEGLASTPVDDENNARDSEESAKFKFFRHGLSALASPGVLGAVALVTISYAVVLTVSEIPAQDAWWRPLAIWCGFMLVRDLPS